jgi:hypothetical protein
MAYVKKSTTYKLVWDEGEYEGLEVRVSSAPVGELAEIMNLSTKSDYASTMELIQKLSERLVSWNITEEDGSATPATLAGLKSLDLGEMTEIVTKWAQAMVHVPDSLGKESTSGKPSLEASLPMAPL